MHVPQQHLHASLQYNDVIDFMNRDLCAFLMRRLSHHSSITYQHSIRVALFSMSIAEAFCEDEAQRTTFLRSVLLHDIGKLAIADEILRKQGLLSPEEWQMMQQHPVQGAELLENFIQSGLVMPDVILYHHENLDGSGYPFSKSERELNMFVRMVRVADSFDSMAFQRGNRMPVSAFEALEELYRWSDVCFDSDIVRAFHEIVLADDDKGWPSWRKK